MMVSGGRKEEQEATSTVQKEKGDTQERLIEVRQELLLRRWGAAPSRARRPWCRGTTALRFQ